MRKTRIYFATIDNGHDYITFEFASDYRAGSVNNTKAAVNSYRRQYGKTISKDNIITIWLKDHR